MYCVSRMPVALNDPALRDVVHVCVVNSSGAMPYRRARKQAAAAAAATSTVLTISLLDVLFQLPLTVLQQAFQITAVSASELWKALAGFRSTSKLARDLCNGVLTDISLQLHKNDEAGNSGKLQLVRKLDQLRSLELCVPKSHLSRMPPRRDSSATRAWKPAPAEQLTDFLESLPALTTLKKLIISNVCLSSATMNLIVQLMPNMEHLSFENCGPDDTELFGPLQRCEKLQSLRIACDGTVKGSETEFQETMGSISLLTQLSELYVGVHLTGAALQKLAGLTALRVLKLPELKAMPTNGAEVFDDLTKNLECLCVGQLNDDMLAALAGKHCLKLLEVSKKLSLSGASVQQELGSLAGLERLVVGGDLAVSPKMLDRLLDVAPGLKAIDCPSGVDITILGVDEDGPESDAAMLLLLHAKGSRVLGLLSKFSFFGYNSKMRFNDYLADYHFPVVMECTSLEFCLCHNMSGKAIGALLHHFPNVRSVCFTCCAGFTQRSMSMILKWPLLMDVRIIGCKGITVSAMAFAASQKGSHVRVHGTDGLGESSSDYE